MGLVMLVLVIPCVIGLLVYVLRKITPGVIVSTPPPPTPAAVVESTSLTPNTSSPEDQADENPPPYEAPTPTTTPTSPHPFDHNWSSAERFIIGTFVFIVLMFTLFALGLVVLAFLYCMRPLPYTVWGPVFWWILYSAAVFGASPGMACWAMLLRNLWGPRAIKKFPITQSWLCMGVIFLGVIILWLPFVATWKGLSWAVEKCQGKFCGDALEEEEEVPVELEEGVRLIDGDGGSSSTSERLDPESAKHSH